MIHHPGELLQEKIQPLQHQIGGAALLDYLIAERSRCLESLVRAVDPVVLHRLQGAVMVLDTLVGTLKPRTP